MQARDSSLSNENVRDLTLVGTYRAKHVKCRDLDASRVVATESDFETATIEQVNASGDLVIGGVSSVGGGGDVEVTQEEGDTDALGLLTVPASSVSGTIVRGDVVSWDRSAGAVVKGYSSEAGNFALGSLSPSDTPITRDQFGTALLSSGKMLAYVRTATSFDFQVGNIQADGAVQLPPVSLSISATNVFGFIRAVDSSHALFAFVNNGTDCEMRLLRVSDDTVTSVATGTFDASTALSRMRIILLTSSLGVVVYASGGLTIRSHSFDFSTAGAGSIVPGGAANTSAGFDSTLDATRLSDSTFLLLFPDGSSNPTVAHGTVSAGPAVAIDAETTISVIIEYPSNSQGTITGLDATHGAVALCSINGSMIQTQVVKVTISGTTPQAVSAEEWSSGIISNLQVDILNASYAMIPIAARLVGTDLVLHAIGSSPLTTQNLTQTVLALVDYSGSTPAVVDYSVTALPQTFLDLDTLPAVGSLVPFAMSGYGGRSNLGGSTQFQTALGAGMATDTDGRKILLNSHKGAAPLGVVGKVNSDGALVVAVNAFVQQFAAGTFAPGNPIFATFGGSLGTSPYEMVGPLPVPVRRAFVGFAVSDTSLLVLTDYMKPHFLPV